MNGVASPWLYGRTVDLLLGSGLAYLFSVPLLALVALDPTSSEGVALTVFVVLVLSGPHYGATLLRVYEARESRRRYAVFSVYFTLALVALTGFASQLPVVGSLLLTLYISWSPWHFAGQNYGITLMQLRRQGLEIDPLEKRLLYLSYVSSFALVLLAIHTGPSSANFAPDGLRTVGEEARGRELFRVYHVLRLGIPQGVAQWLLPLLVAGYVGTTGRVLGRFVRRAGWGAVLPAISILATQALWFAVPALLQFVGVEASASLVFSAVWTSAFHSLQYLWITSYYAKRSEKGFRLSSYLAKATLIGAALNTLPILLLAPGALGKVPFDSGLAALVFSVVNLHHFVLDGAIWKLRDGQVARALLRDPPAGQASELLRPARSWLRGPLWLAGLASAAVVLAGELETRAFEDSLRAGQLDLARAEQALDRLRFMGRESAWNRLAFGARLAAAGDRERAGEAFERSLAIQPNLEAWLGRGALYELDRNWPAALDSYESALELEPGDPRAREHRDAVRRRFLGS